MADDLIGFGKAAEALVESGERFLNRLVGPLLDEKGAQWAETSRRRYNLRVIAGKAAEEVGDKPVQQIPWRTFSPLVNAASNEDDESMQSKWAKLLATAAIDPDAAPPAYVQVLSALSPADARVLDFLYKNTDRFGDQKLSTLKSVLGVLPDVFAVLNSLLNLERLAVIHCTERLTTVVWQDLNYAHVDLGLSPFGRSFMAACVGSATKEPSPPPT